MKFRQLLTWQPGRYAGDEEALHQGNIFARLEHGNDGLFVVHVEGHKLAQRFADKYKARLAAQVAIDQRQPAKLIVQSSPYIGTMCVPPTHDHHGPRVIRRSGDVRWD